MIELSKCIYPGRSRSCGSSRCSSGCSCTCGCAGCGGGCSRRRGWCLKFFVSGNNPIFLLYIFFINFY